MSTTPILQFGTSRFLQAHVDFFVAQALQTGRALGPISVVQTSGNATRARRLAALAEGFDVRIRGLQNAQRIDSTERVTSVTRALSLNSQTDAVRRILRHEARIIVSNTSDAGFRPQPADTGSTLDPAMSFPAKLAHLLRECFEAGGTPPQIMPTELVQGNGAVLRALVLDAAAGMDAAYRDWLADAVTWVDSLVDRIVSEPLEPAGAVAEPYALWAIADQPGLVLPCDHPCIQVVPDLGPVERRKLFILNLGHTWMVADWLARGRQGGSLVRERMADPDLAARLRELYTEEVQPAFTTAGEGSGIDAYIATTLERFANPYLDHRLSDIAQNHTEKLRRRIGDFLDWAQAQGDTGKKPRLSAALTGELS